MKDYVQARWPDPNVMADVNRLRAEASAIYQPDRYPSPSLVFVNDGTGFGKSYGVLRQHIDRVNKQKTHRGPLRQMIFITPMKAQFDFDPDLVKEAGDHDIAFLTVLAKGDLGDLEFESWVPLYDTQGVFRKIKNGEHYKKWIQCAKKLNPNAFIKRVLQLGNIVSSIESTQRIIEIERWSFKPDLHYIKEHETGLAKLILYLSNHLVKVAREALNERDRAIAWDKYFSNQLNNTTKDFDLRAKVIKTLMPLMYARFKPCIILATSNRFDYTVIHPKLRSRKPSDDESSRMYTDAGFDAEWIDDSIEGEEDLGIPIWRIYNESFDAVIGSKKSKIQSSPSDYAMATLTDKVKYLQDERQGMFPQDVNQSFHEAAITFTIVIDEEHESHQRFMEKTTKRIISDEIMISQIISVMSRLVRQTERITELEAARAPFFEQKLQLVNDFRQALATHCDLRPEFDLTKFLSVFEHNIDYPHIDKQQVDQVLALARNVFSFNPKHYVYAETMKSIRFHPTMGDAGIEIYFSESQEDQNFSLYELNQVIMAMIYVCSELSADSQFMRYLRHAEDSNHNVNFTKFVRNTNRLHSDLQALFSRYKDTVEIDHFFAYFVPKIVISLDQVSILDYSHPSLEDKIFVNYTLNLIGEQPEAKLLRMLYRTHNSAICLSATTGFADNIIGQFNRECLRVFAQQLDIHIHQRSRADSGVLEALRTARGNVRDVSITVFDAEAERLFADEDDAVKKTRARWGRSIIEANKGRHINLRSPYKRREFFRSLDVIMQASAQGMHTLALLLSEQPLRALSHYINQIECQAQTNPGIKFICVPGGHQRVIDRIFECRPIKGGHPIRVILYNAELKRNPDVDLRAYTEVHDPEMRIVFLAAYRSAGTGLNYFVCHRFIDELQKAGVFEMDFERLVLVNSPYYSGVMNPQNHGYYGLSSISNLSAIFKRRASMPDTVLISDFEPDLYTGEDVEFLFAEHFLELLKALIQAVGRVERKDARMTTHICLPDDLYAIAMLQFSKLRRQTENAAIICCMSLLNTRLMEHCKTHEGKICFASEGQRRTFEDKMRRRYESLRAFTENTILEIVLAARAGDRDAMAFNEALRDINSIQAPRAYMELLSNSAWVQRSPYLIPVIEQLYIDRDLEAPGVKFYRHNDKEVLLSDIQRGDRPYEPEREVVVDYSHLLSEEETSLRHLFSLNRNIVREAFQRYVPHPFFLPHLKGNMGEYLFDMVIEHLGVKSPMTLGELIDTLGWEAYECFDRYLIRDDGTLLCIDIKNWSLQVDNPGRHKELSERAREKAARIARLAGNHSERLQFIYLNTRYELNNTITRLIAPQSGTLHFMNLFTNCKGYVPTDSGSRVKELFVINPKLMALLPRINA